MNTLIRSGIVTVAGVVAASAIGVGIASAAQSDDGNPAGKREDTSSSWVVPSVDNDDNDDLGDSPTANSVNVVNTPTVNSVNTVNSVDTPTVNSVNSVNTAQSVNTN